MVADILIWESANAFLLIPVVIGLVMLVRWIRGRPVFTEKDWLFLFGHPQKKVLSLHMWLRFAMLWFAVVLIGSVEGLRTLVLWSHSIPWGSFSHRDCSLASCASITTSGRRSFSSYPFRGYEKIPIWGIDGKSSMLLFPIRIGLDR
jgi:hypothetical protein